MIEPALFQLGEVRITPLADAELDSHEIAAALQRHQRGDFGDMSPEDVYQNRRGLSSCGKIMSVFRSANGTEFWVQTHGTRSHTIILLPGE